MDDREFGRRFHAARVYRGKTQAEVADLLGLDQRSVSRIERGERDLRISEAHTLCQKLDLPVSWFLADDIFAAVSGP